MRVRDPFPWRAVVGASSVTAMANLPAYLVGALAITIRAELDFSTAGTGLAVSAFMATSAVAGPMLGRWVQHWGAALALRVGSAVTGLTLLGIAIVVRSWGVLVIMLVVAGAANSTGQMGSNLALAERSSPANDGLAFGLKQAAVPLATMLAGLSVPVFVGAMGWRRAFALGGVLGLAIAAAAPRFVVDRRQDEARATHRRQRGDRQPVDMGIVGFVAVGAFFASGVAMSLAVFIVEFAVSTGWASGAAGLLLAACSVGVIVARVTAGWIMDLRARRGASPVALLPVALMIALGSLGVLLVMLAGQSPVVLALGAMLALVSGWGWPGLMHLAVVSMNRGAAAVSTGVVLFGVFGGGVVMPVVLGILAERVSYEAGWALNASFLVLAALAFLRAHRAYGRRTSAPGVDARHPEEA
jgi:MFS family permease